MPAPRFEILLIGGSLRRGSVNEAALLTARGLLADVAEARLFAGLDLLPHFNPDADCEPLHPAVADLRARIAAADALLFCTPEYAGALPGSFKNLLDWTVGGIEMGGKPVAWINTSIRGSPDGGAAAHESLRRVLTYVGADIVEPACVRAPVHRARLGEDGRVEDPAARAAIAASVEALVAHLVLKREETRRSRRMKRSE